ncbi:MAG TPA: hypothetical protein VIJ51_05810 [Solirubrobacteraceae bacterium]
MELVAGGADEAVEGRSVGSLDPLLELGVDVERHLRVGVADLTHHPLDVEVVGQQRDRDVGAAQAVGRRVGQGRQPAADEIGGRPLCCVTDDLPDALARHPPTSLVGDGEAVGAGGQAGAAQAVDVLDEGLDEVGAHLDLADPGLGLRVGDPEPGTFGVVEADVAQPDVAELARADAAAAEDLDHGPATDVVADWRDLQAADVVADGRLGEAELGGDLGGPETLGQARGDPGGGAVGRRARRPGWAEGGLLVGGGVDERDELVHLEERPRRLRHANAHALAPRWVAVDVLVLNRVIEHGCEGVDQLANRRGRQRTTPPAEAIAEVGSGRDGCPELRGLAEFLCLERLAELAVDLVEAIAREVREQVVRQAPAVVGLGVGVDWLVAEHAVDLRSKPSRCVLVEGRDGWRLGLRWRRRHRDTPLPDAGPHACEQVAELGARSALVPAAATPAHAAGAFVHDLALPLAGGPEAQVKRAGTVAQDHNLDRTICRTRHQGLNSYSDGAARPGRIPPMAARARIGKRSAPAGGSRRGRPRDRLGDGTVARVGEVVGGSAKAFAAVSGLKRSRALGPCPRRIPPRSWACS